MKILINYQGRDGAGPVCALEWAKGFQKIGCDVYAAISCDATNRNQWIEHLSEDHIFWIKTHKDKDGFSFIITTLRLIFFDRFRMKWKFKKNHFDFTLRTLYGHWAYIVDKSVNRDRIVTLCHDPKIHSGEKKYIGKLYHKHIRQSDDVFVLTNSFKEVVHKNYGIPMKHIHYVPHGRMNMYQARQEVKYQKYFDPKKVNFVFFGRIEKYKGLHVLCEACQILKRKRKDFTVLVAGNGDFQPYKKGFEDLGCATVINRFISDEEVGSLFEGANIVTTVPYIDATQSGVIPLAYEYDTPIIASDIGGLREQLDDGKIGLLFENGNAEDLAEKMEVFIDHPEEFDNQVHLMRKYRDTLNWDVVAQQFIDELYGAHN